MSSFDQAHGFFLFELRDGRRKLSYGKSAEDALEVLRLRLTEAEMSEILPDRYLRIRQRDLAQYIGELG